MTGRPPRPPALPSPSGYGPGPLSPVLRARVRAAGLDLTAAGLRVSAQSLRRRGVRGGTALLIGIRDELIAAGELPPEARRVYTRTSLGPRASQAVLSRPEPSQAGLSRPEPSQSVLSRPEPSQGPPKGRARRRMRGAIAEYNCAVRRIFGADRAGQIGAAPAGRNTKNRA